MNVYWIDSYREYDSKLVESVFKLFENYYKPLLKSIDLNFIVIDISSLDFSKSQIIYNGQNILNENAIAYINCINPSLQTEKIQIELYNIAIKSKKLSVLNYIPHFPLIDKNKNEIFKIANLLGINTTPSFVIEDLREISKNVEIITKKFDFPLILKPIDMFGGIAVNQINNQQQLTSLLETILLTQRTFIIQKKLEIVSDCRIYIADDKFIACLRRTPINFESLGNIAKGATSSSFIPPDKIINQSIEISKKINASFLCVDWFETSSNYYYFNEIETAGGFVQLPEAERLETAKKLFRWRKNE